MWSRTNLTWNFVDSWFRSAIRRQMLRRGVQPGRLMGNGFYELVQPNRQDNLGARPGDLKAPGRADLLARAGQHGRPRKFRFHPPVILLAAAHASLGNPMRLSIKVTVLPSLPRS